MPEDIGGTAWAKFSANGDRLIAFLEKGRLSIVGIFVYVILLAFGRDMAEYVLLDPSFLVGGNPWIYSIAEHCAFYVVVFLGLVLLLTAFSGRGFRKALNLITSIYWIILLPPFLDHFLFGDNQGYAYFSWTDLVNAFFHFSGESFHPGQGLEVATFLFALFAYVIWTQRNNLFFLKERAETLLRVGFLILFTIVSMFIMATPGAYLPVGVVNGSQVFPYFDQTKFYQFHLFLFMYYLLAGLLLVTVISYMAMKRSFRRMITSMRPFQTLLFGMVVAGGIVVGWKSVNTSLVFSITTSPYWVNIEFVVMSVASALIAWQVSTIWNDISDSRFDDPGKEGRAIASGVVNRTTVLQGSIVLMIVALVVAYLLSPIEFLILAAVFILSFLYSFRPVRFKNYTMSSVMVGLGAFLAFVYGFLTPFSVVDTQYSYDKPINYLTGAVDVAPLDISAIVIGLIIFLGLVIGSMVTDLDGYEEDRRAGVRTIYTTLGIERGLKVVSALIFVASLTTLELFDGRTDLIIFPVLGAAAAITFYRYRNPKIVMALALLGFVYATFRYLGMI
jgi:4-hydroxybenzoate polyprenyltransferase